MRDKFNTLPRLLKKNILCKIGLGLCFLTVFILVCIFAEHTAFALAPGAFTLFSLIDGVGMAIRCFGGEYVELVGTCIEVHKSTVRRRTKYIVVETARGALKLPIRMKLQSVSVGSTVTVYIPDHASVYDHKGNMVVCEFYGIEVVNKKGE